MKIKVGFLYTLIRPDEKCLLNDLKSRKDVEIEMIDVRALSFNLNDLPRYDIDVLFVRCINHSRTLHAIMLFEEAGIPCVNTSKVATICGDKFRTSLALQQHNVPQPEVRVAFTEDAALGAIEEMGYPVVLKPAVGSWGRLLSKITDRNAAETILEHKTNLGTYQYSVLYIQKYVEKGERDIRAIVVDDVCVAASYRTSRHWKTNAALGAVTTNCPVTTELSRFAVDTARATGGGVVGVDIFETTGGYMANEVNCTMEFRHTQQATGVDIPKYVNDYVLKIASEHKNC